MRVESPAIADCGLRIVDSSLVIGAWSLVIGTFRFRLSDLDHPAFHGVTSYSFFSVVPESGMPSVSSFNRLLDAESTSVVRSLRILPYVSSVRITR